jgi:phosphonate transport system substrate-binding protein
MHVRPAKLALATFASAALAASLVACGSSSADEAGASENSAASTSAAAGGTLVLASIPMEESTSLAGYFEGIIAVIEKEMGVTVEYNQVTDYAGLIEAQRAGKVDIAAYGPFSYVTAKDTGVPIEVLAATVNAPDDLPKYKSYGIANPDSGIKSIADMKGKTICFVDPGSTSGYLYPIAGLMKEGIDPEKDITPMFAGGHDASALAVKSGQCDAGFASDTMVNVTLPGSGQLAEGEIEKIWESGDITQGPVAISTTLPADQQAQLTDLFQNKLNAPWMAANGYCATEADCVLPEGYDYGYVKLADADFDGVREVCDVTKADACN